MPKRALHLILIPVLAIAVGACSTGGRAGALAAEAKPGNSKEELAAMIAWTVPANGFKAGELGFVQVSLTPAIAMDEAMLRLVSLDAGLEVIPPDRFSLSGLKPDNGARPVQKNSPPDPPALGMTIMRTFQVLARPAGTHVLRIELVYRGRNQILETAIAVH